MILLAIDEKKMRCVVGSCVVGGCVGGGVEGGIVTNSSTTYEKVKMSIETTSGPIS